MCDVPSLASPSKISLESINCAEFEEVVWYFIDGSHVNPTTPSYGPLGGHFYGRHAPFAHPGILPGHDGGGFFWRRPGRGRLLHGLSHLEFVPAAPGRRSTFGLLCSGLLG